MRARNRCAIILLALLTFAVPMSASLARQADDTGRLPFKLEAPEIDRTLVDGEARYGRDAARSGPLRVLIELHAAPTARVYADGLERGDKNKASADAKAAQAAIERTQQSLVSTLQSARIGAKVFGRMQRVFNGIHATIEPAKLDAIAGLPGVKSVQPTTIHYLDNTSGVPLVQAPQIWANAAVGNATGKGISIGVIDTGIDYIHTDFGGAGTPEAYTANNTTVNGDGFFPSTKVVGGYDFVGDAYNASSSDPAALTPKPDPDPMDCNGHGSHVAGTAAGYGANADGSTYTGPWNASTPFDSLRIGPGAAPEAELWALRVFGCAGSTDVTIQAIEFAVDPNRDGDFADHLDVINLSLGSSLGDPADPNVVAINNAVDAGVIAALSAGNTGDTFYITGSPGIAAKALSVASSQDALDVLDAFRVNAPASIAGVKIGSDSTLYVWTGKPPVTGDLVYPPTQRSGCLAFTPANATLLAGKIALLDWTETSPGVSECGSGVRIANAAAAGAIGVVYDYGKPEIDTAFGGSALIPSIYTNSIVGAELKANLGAGVNVTLTPEYNNSLKQLGEGKVDSISTFSSRGPASRTSALKPDIAAPGQSIFSADALSGNQGESLNGTSMASPHAAGAMALLRQIRPSWTVEELKALVMNTASAPVRLGIAPTSVRLGPQRAGSNRMTLANAVASQVIAYNADDAGQVSVSFGAVEVLDSKTAVKNVRVVNKGSSSAGYTLAYQPAVDLPGVTFSVSPASVTVAPGGTANVVVTMQATAASMPHAYDPSISLQQSGDWRHWLSEESGHVVLTPGAGTTLRVPVYAAARAASDMHATTSAVATGNAPAINTTIELAGTSVGSGQALVTPAATDEVSLLTAFELQHSSPNDSASDATVDSADLQYVGVFSDYPAARSIADPDGTGPASGTTLAFGIATHADWSTPQANLVEVDVLIDTNNDGTADFVLFNYNRASLLSAANNPADVFVAALYRINPNQSLTLISAQYLNGVPASRLNTVPYNTNVMMLPVAAADLGLTDAASGFSYTVETFHRLTDDAVVDVSPRLTYNAAKPGLNLTSGQAGLPIYLDLPGTSVALSYSKADFDAAKSQGLLLLHHLNGSGKRADVVRFQDTFRRMLPQITAR